MSDAAPIDADIRSCEACGRSAASGDRRCRVCGFGLGAAWSIVGAAPAAFIAAGIAATGAPLPAWIAANVPVHVSSPGFLESSWQLGRSLFVLGCTTALPYVYPAVAGGAATLARQVATSRTAGATAVGATLGASGALASTQALSPNELGFRALACLLGALLTAPLIRWLSRPWMQALGRATRHRPLLTTLLAVSIAHGFVLVLLAAFGVTLLAVWLMCLIATTYAVLRGVWHAMFGSTRGRQTTVRENWDGSRTRIETEDGEEVRSVHEKKGIFGDDSKVERDATGNVVSVSTLKKPFFGEPYWERRGADGELMSTSRVEKDWITGEEKTVLRDPRGAVLAEQRVETPLFGDSALVTRDGDGEVVAKQQVRQELFGGPVVVTEDASGKVVETTRVETPILGSERLVHEGKSVDALLEQRRREKEGGADE